MKTAGDILSSLFDERFMKKAQGYSKLFDSWEEVTAKNGIASAAAHSRIKDLDRGILLVEMDHPGWKQILQTKQTKLLDDFSRRFPELDISGISLILGRPNEKSTPDEPPSETEAAPAQPAVFEEPQTTEPAAKGFDTIKDEDFKEKLQRLGQTVADRERKR